jgi:uncharacterized membrane protein YhhN
MVLLTAAGAVAVVALVLALHHESPLRFVAKPVASLCFIATAIAGGATDAGYGSWVLVALVLSALGDVALLGTTSATFLAGLGSFLLGHVAYVVAFGVRGIDIAPTVLAGLVLIGPIVIVLRWLWPHVSGDMRPPVAAYTVVISVMVAGSVGTVAFETDGRIVVAAVAFYLSDLTVARDHFVAPGFVNRLWGLPLYYAAQFVFAWTVVT